ncbi:MAG: formyltransferase family protein [Candidatus Woesearchaeota archaeon]
MNLKEFQKPVIVFLSSSATNIAFEVARSCPEFEVFLILDRKIPLDVEEEMLGNFYVHYFDKDKIYDKNKTQYFDILAMQLLDYEPDLIVCSNYYKLLPQTFIEFVNFRNSLTKIVNIHHADLRIIDDQTQEMKYTGLHAWKREFKDTQEFLSTIHYVENEEMDTGEHITYSSKTTFKELEELKLLTSLDELENLRVCNVIIHYHEQSKVLHIIVEEIKKIINM